ncbi:MAG TPA: tRNA (adenosine(37)-N6)-dimethylallyltransferase MiaA [Acidimicrobiales bacterium]|nr:tRNA (adenosine(37)-N6)-dimethylallyltransferase MiaA [Acidimicrobiales bacterium]
MSVSPARAVALVGPTASGKSALAHELALESQGDVEVISVDAMGVYRGMDIGTAKPTRAERDEVKYHLLDLVEPSEEFTVAQYQREAKSAAGTIESAGHGVLYVGGTGLYGRAVLDDLDIPARYPEIHRELEARVEDELPTLYQELLGLDPLAASRIEATNARRVVRALEVTLGAGRPFSSFGSGLLSYGPVRVVQVGLDCELDVLDERIESRFRRWMDQGLLEEVVRLASARGGLGRTARQAVGYRELLRHVEEGEPLTRSVESAITQSRRLARRQRSWFRRDPRVEWFVDAASAKACLGEVLGGADVFVRD